MDQMSEPWTEAMSRAVPPDDPDGWSDEQWIEWLAETDRDAPAPEPPGDPLRHRSVGTQMLYGAMFGLREAIYGPQEQVTIVQEADGEPDEPQSLDIHLEPDHPEESTVTVRPWLFD